ncbi:MAG: hypothetical protein EP312_04985 [Gammaproteobacteria bacterium]|nr:MAG: hypothetical protein EP312_04985 [Gammaproteobacteria bacterium]
MDANGFLQQLDQAIIACLQAMRDGLDVPPATRYRLEGQIEAAIALGFLTADTARQRVDGHYRAVLGEVPLQPEQDGRVRLPLRMRVAPVYPSTRD